jgi:hypothetical protein
VQEEKSLIENFKRRIERASSLDFKALGNIEIDDRKSTANKLFKWILVALYKEPESKFYWPNFKEQVL